MAHSAGGRKGRAIVGLMGLAPQRYFSPGRIAVLVGCTRTRVSDALAALAESQNPADRKIAVAYRTAAKAVGQDTDAGSDRRCWQPRGIESNGGAR